MTENDQDAADQPESTGTAAKGKFETSVDAFEAEADAWLTPADHPQLVALRAIAHEIDRGKFQAALVSQFTLIHRALLARRPGGNPSPSDPQEPGLFEVLGGVWQA